MKKSILMFLSALLLISALSMVSAERNVTYNVYEATLLDNGTISYTTNPVGDFYSVGFVCTSASCSTVNATLFPERHISGNSFIVSYPTSLLSPFGYGVYIYKEGYIDWEIYANWSGTGDVTRNAYLSRKQSGSAPIMNFNVLNQITPWKPLEINVSTGIDANSYSAIVNAGPLNYAPGELSNFRKVNTSVTLEIRNSADSLLRRETAYYNIPYSGVQNISFIHIFNATGVYNISVYTDVVDAKIISSTRQTASALTQVISQNLTNYRYSRLTNLSYSPVFPLVNNSMNFSFGVLSNYVDIFGSLTPVNSSVNATFYRNNNFFSSTVFVIPTANSTQFTNFGFSRFFNETGNYTLVLNATPVSNQGNQSISDLTSVTFIINLPTDNQTNNNQTNQSNQTNPAVPTINIISPVAGNYNYTNILVNISVSGSNLSSAWYNWNGVNTTYNAPIFVNFTEGTHTLFVWANNTLGNTSSASVSFNVNSSSGGNGGDDDDDDDDGNDNNDDGPNEQNQISGVSLPLSIASNSSAIDLSSELVQDVRPVHRFIFWLIILILLLLILIVLIYIVKYSE